MSGKGSIFRFISDAAIFIILEIAALSMLSHNGALQNIWITKGFHAFYTVVWGKTESVKQYFSLKKENDELASENFRLFRQVRYYEDLIRKAGISDSASAYGQIRTEASGYFDCIQASIAKISTNRQHNYIVIDKGSEDGISPQSGIITEKGAIGIVDAVSRHYSYAISFMNSGMTVSARIGRKGPVGPMVWDGVHSNGALLKEIPHHIVVEAGDTVFTSGFSSVFPPDIPIGTTSGAKLVDGSTYEIKVRLFEDFRSLKHVAVVRSTGKDEIEELVSRQ